MCESCAEGCNVNLWGLCGCNPVTSRDSTEAHDKGYLYDICISCYNMWYLRNKTFSHLNSSKDNQPARYNQEFEKN